MTTTIITKDVAAHVLSHYNHGGHEGGSFTTALIALIAKADLLNRAKLEQAFPDYVAAVELAANTPGGIDFLKDLTTDPSILLGAVRDPA